MTTADEARKTWRAAEERWLSQPGGDWASLVGILVGTIAGENPDLLLKAAAYADRLVSVDRIVEEARRR